jgi:hypothetical protein
VKLEASDSKHRREDVLPLHPELVTSLQQWLEERRHCESDADSFGWLIVRQTRNLTQM